jgi:hypothetical protein
MILPNVSLTGIISFQCYFWCFEAAMNICFNKCNKMLIGWVVENAQGSCGLRGQRFWILFKESMMMNRPMSYLTRNSDTRSETLPPFLKRQKFWNLFGRLKFDIQLFEQGLIIPSSVEIQYFLESSQSEQSIKSFSFDISVIFKDLLSPSLAFNYI